MHCKFHIAEAKRVIVYCGTSSVAHVQISTCTKEIICFLTQIFYDVPDTFHTLTSLYYEHFTQLSDNLYQGMHTGSKKKYDTITLEKLHCEFLR